MDLEQTLTAQLEHLETSLRRLDGIESERAGAGDLPFVKFGLLGYKEHPGYDETRFAFEDTFGPSQSEMSKLGGDWGAKLLATTVRKLLASTELATTKKLTHAMYWVATVQEEVDEVTRPTPSEGEGEEIRYRSDSKSEAPAPQTPSLKRERSPSLSLSQADTRTSSVNVTDSPSPSKYVRLSSDQSKEPSVCSSAAFNFGDVVLAPFSQSKPWPCLVLDPSKVPQKPIKGRKTSSSVLLTWIPNGREMEWRDPSKLSALTATTAKDLLASKKAQPRYAQDKRHFKLALETFLDDTKMEEWKEQALSELEGMWREERGVEKMKKEEAEKFKLGCCERPWDGEEAIVACDECEGWEHASCIKYLCPSCTKEAG